MKRFSFRLQPLLNFKGYQERLARQEMATALKDVLDCEEMIENLKNNLIRSERQMDKIVTRGVSAAGFQQYQTYLRGMTDTISFEKHRKTGLEKVLDEKRDLLKQKTIAKKTMERLREKQQEAYGREVLMDEQKELDEICALKTARGINHDAR